MTPTRDQLTIMLRRISQAMEDLEELEFATGPYPTAHFEEGRDHCTFERDCERAREACCIVLNHFK